MNESLLVRFESPSRSLRVVRFRVNEGVVFDHHPDASPLNLAIGLQPLFPSLLDPVRRRHDWRDNRFFLDATVDSGGLRFSGFQGDPEGFPEGPYDVTVEVEALRFRDSAQRVILRSQQQTQITLTEEPDPRRVRLHDNVDPLTAAVLENPDSQVDGAQLRDWLHSDVPRATRKACLLNILAKLRVPPAPAQGFPDPLTPLVQFVYVADVDRVYAAVSTDLPAQLQRLLDAKLWVFEGHPAAAIHQRLRRSLARFNIPESEAEQFVLNSYRQGGRNCLQIVTATRPPGAGDARFYADIDIDLGNPLWDLEGLFVHIGELLDASKTDHFRLHKAFQDGPTSDFLYYDIV